jgi:hypothetical protein
MILNTYLNIQFHSCFFIVKKRFTLVNLIYYLVELFLFCTISIFITNITVRKFQNWHHSRMKNAKKSQKISIKSKAQKS